MEKNIRAMILEEANRCVNGQREQDYGTPEDNFGIIARLWNAYMDEPLFTSLDVAMMMSLLKIARIRTGDPRNLKLDSFIDLAGYSACGAEIADRAHQELEKYTNNKKENEHE